MTNIKNNTTGYDRLKSFQLGGVVEPTEEQETKKLIYSLYKLIKSGKSPKGGDEKAILAFLKENETAVKQAENEFSTLQPEELQNNEEFNEFYAQFQPEENAQFAAKGAKLQKLNSFRKIEPLKAKKESTPADAVSKSASNPVLTKEDGGSLKGNPLNGPTIIGKKKPTYTTKNTTLINKVPNKSVDVGVKSANSHNEKVVVKQKVQKEAEGGAMKKKVMPKVKKKKCSCGCDMILSKAEGGKVIETCSCKCGGKLKKKK